jgi:hypothetical protein
MVFSDFGFSILDFGLKNPVATAPGTVPIITSPAIQNPKSKIQNPKIYPSTIRNKCGTFATIPRTAALSGRSTIWLSFVNPRLPTIRLCFEGVAIALRYH